MCRVYYREFQAIEHHAMGLLLGEVALHGSKVTYGRQLYTQTINVYCVVQCL
jgi:hypothetical protein